MRRDVPHQQILIAMRVEPVGHLPVEVPRRATVWQHHDHWVTLDMAQEVRPLDPGIAVVAEAMQLHQHRERPLSLLRQDHVVTCPLAERLAEELDRCVAHVVFLPS